MSQRLLLNLILFFVFSLVQIGTITHEISHLSELTQSTTPDENTAVDQCGQCIASAQAASGLPTHSFVVHLNQSHFQLTTFYIAHLAAVLVASYSARAPPIALNR